MNKWDVARGSVYGAVLIGSGLAMANLADFNMATGDLDIRPFNLYGFMAAAGGAVSSALAGVALLFRWGKK